MVEISIFARAAGFTNRVVSVVQNVQKDLLQLVRVPDHAWQFLVEVFDHFNAVAVEVVRAELDRPTQNGVELHGLFSAAASGGQS